MQLPKHKVSTTLTTYVDLHTCMLVNKSHVNFIFLLYTAVEKYVEVSRRPVGAWRRYWCVSYRFLFGLKMLKKFMCLLSCSIGENKI